MADRENKPVTRGVGGRWLPGGQSPNPGGRAKGVASYVRAQTRDCQELIDHFIQIFRGQPIRAAVFEKGKRVEMELIPTLAERNAAAEVLLDRGIGRPAQTIDLPGEGRQSTVIVLSRDMGDDPLADKARALTEGQDGGQIYQPPRSS